MNDKALYQLERAVDALKLMAVFAKSKGMTVLVFLWRCRDSLLHGMTMLSPSVMRVHSNHGNIEITTGTEGIITFS